jgi:hypothetical protein
MCLCVFLYQSTLNNSNKRYFYTFCSGLILRLVIAELEVQVPAAVIRGVAGIFKEMVESAIKIETQREKNKLLKK